MARLSPIALNVRGVGVVIRSVEPGDAAAQLRFARELFATSAYTLTTLGEFTMTEDEERAFIAGALDDPGTVFMDALVSGEIVASLHLAAGKRKKIGHQALLGMGVAAGWRGRGIGRAILETAVGWARAHPVLEMVTLGVYEENEPAVRLYGSLGFVVYGRLPGALRHEDGTTHTNLDMYLRVKP
ncbi:MAG: GNAT family N-acetyltransferase [Phycisphaeraceae bacterium]|nr:MAG: GNAT family N-acetyltransferase [Phycisphaeraceae bacterium]